MLHGRNNHSNTPTQTSIIDSLNQIPKLDDWGRTIQQGGQHYEYDSQNRLINITTTNANGQSIPVAHYRYNTFNQRIAKTTYNNQGAKTKTTYYFYDGNQLIAETTDDASQEADNLKQYIWLNDTPIAVLQQGDLFYIHTDHRNAPIAVTDNTSKLVWQASNEDFGFAHVNRQSKFELNLRLSNQYYDSESGLHYNTNRYYDALNAQYLTPDPLGLAAGPDLFAFALNQPHSVSDPDGLIPAVKDIDYNNFSHKLYYAGALGVQGLPSSFNEFGTELWKLIGNKTTVTVVGGALAIWGGLHFIGVGQVVDAFLVSVLAASVGPLKALAALQFVSSFAKFTYQTYKATCIKDLKAAGKILSDGLRDALLALGSAKAIEKATSFMKSLGTYVNKAKALYKDNSVSTYIQRAINRRKTTSAPLPAPKLTALQSFLDKNGRFIPKFSANSRYSWQEPQGKGVLPTNVWNYKKEANQVAAMEKFIKDTEKPVATWTPQVANGNGFDYAYLKPNGKLVIVEAKSNNGYHSSLTAFGGGAKGIKQIEINEIRLKDAINENKDALTDSQYDNLMNTIDNRNYEIELYVSSRTKLSASKITKANENMGMPMKRIIELPEILP